MADRTPVTPLALALQPMVYVEDMPASVEFYEHLGGSIIHGSRDDDYVLMQVGTAQVGLLIQAPNQGTGVPTIELHFHSPVPLDQVEHQLRGQHIAAAELADDVTFGRQLHVRGPDGLLVKINQRAPDLYS